MDAAGVPFATSSRRSPDATPIAGSCSARITTRGASAAWIRAPGSRRRSKSRAAWRRSPRSGWQPERTIVVRVLGRGGVRPRSARPSTPRRMQKELREKAVVYINTDLYDARPLRRRRHAVAARLSRAGDARRAALRRQGLGLRPVARQRVAAPAGRTAASRAGRLRGGAGGARQRRRLRRVPGLSSACRRCRWSSTSSGSYGPYHSNYDTRQYVEQHADPGFKVGQTLARVLGLTVHAAGVGRGAAVPLFALRAEDQEFIDGASAWAVDDNGRRRVALDLSEARVMAGDAARSGRGYRSALERRPQVECRERARSPPRR